MTDAGRPAVRPDGGADDPSDRTAPLDPRLDGFAAVVYDLDGTLVDLAVDWDAVAADATALSREFDVDVAGMTLWDMLDADGTDHAEAVDRLIVDRERDGARGSTRLAHADDLLGRAEAGRTAVGVCSLNHESAVRAALETHGLADAVDAVVGRGTVQTRKPSPEPLLETLRRLDVDPEGAVFLGDSDRDALTADRAEVAFVYVGDGPSGF